MKFGYYCESSFDFLDPLKGSGDLPSFYTLRTADIQYMSTAQTQILK